MNSMKFFFTAFTIAICTFPVHSKAEDAARGAELFRQCISCHGEKGDGIPAQKAPRIAGQYDWYILKQLQDIKSGVARKNPVMNPFVSKLSEQDMEELAAYISKL